MTENKQNRTAEEQQIINAVAKRKGEEWAEKHASLILTQARRVGVL